MVEGLGAADTDTDTEVLLISLCFDCGVSDDFNMYMAFACVKTMNLNA